MRLALPNRELRDLFAELARDWFREAACAEALKQIKEKQYAEDLRRQGMKTVLRYGMAFCGKDCMVVTEKLPDREEAM